MWRIKFYHKSHEKIETFKFLGIVEALYPVVSKSSISAIKITVTTAIIAFS
jgi:hypothetical protein